MKQNAPIKKFSAAKQKALPDLLTEHIKAELRREERLRAEKLGTSELLGVNGGTDGRGETTRHLTLDGRTWDEYPA